MPLCESTGFQTGGTRMGHTLGPMPALAPPCAAGNDSSCRSAVASCRWIASRTTSDPAEADSFQVGKEPAFTRHAHNHTHTHTYFD